MKSASRGATDTDRMCLDYKLAELASRFPYQFPFRLRYISETMPAGWANLFGIACCRTDIILETSGYKTQQQKSRIFKGWAAITTDLDMPQLWYHDISITQDESVAEKIFDLIRDVEDLAARVCRSCGVVSQHLEAHHTHIWPLRRT